MRTIWICFPIIYTGVVHSTWPSWAMWRTHALLFNKWQKKKKKKKTLHMSTHDAMQGCGLTSWVVWINDKFHDTRERNMTIRSDIWNLNIRSLGFGDIRECVTLWRLILPSLGCNLYVSPQRDKPLSSIVLPWKYEENIQFPKSQPILIGWTLWWTHRESNSRIWYLNFSFFFFFSWVTTWVVSYTFNRHY